MSKARWVDYIAILLTLSACLNFPEDADECLLTCTALAEMCLDASDLCFEGCGNDLTCARKCYQISQRCTVDAMNCVSVCIEKAEEDLD